MMTMRRLEISELEEVAAGVYGPKWATPLAEDLSHQAQRKVAPGQVHQWCARTRPVPVWVSEAILPALRRRAYALQRQALLVHEIADGVRHDIASHLPDEDDDSGDTRYAWAQDGAR